MGIADELHALPGAAMVLEEVRIEVNGGVAQ